METIRTTSDWNNVAEVELVYRNKVKASLRPVVKSSKDAYRLLLESWDKNKLEFIEQFRLLLLNRSGKVLGLLDVSTGGICGTVADPRVVFAAALKANAAAVILSHNHPSGNTKPSREDEKLTDKMKEAGKLLDITVHDHIIVAAEEYYSFADEGLL